MILREPHVVRDKFRPSTCKACALALCANSLLVIIFVRTINNINQADVKLVLIYLLIYLFFILTH